MIVECYESLAKVLGPLEGSHFSSDSRLERSYKEASAR